MGHSDCGPTGPIHSEVLFENTVAASSLYNEVVAAEVCEELGLATEPRTVTAGRRPVMEIAGVPHELIGWTAKRGGQIAACLTELEHEYVTAVNDDGELKYLPAVSEGARVELMRMAAHKTRPPKQKARPLAQLRAWWKASAILNFWGGAQVHGAAARTRGWDVAARGGGGPRRRMAHRRPARLHPRQHPGPRPPRRHRPGGPQGRVQKQPRPGRTRRGDPAGRLRLLLVRGDDRGRTRPDPRGLPARDRRRAHRHRRRAHRAADRGGQHRAVRLVHDAPLHRRQLSPPADQGRRQPGGRPAGAGRRRRRPGHPARARHRAPRRLPGERPPPRRPRPDHRPRRRPPPRHPRGPAARGPEVHWPPEYATSYSTATPAADVFSLAVLTYRYLCADIPRHRHSRLETAPAALRPLLSAALVPEPKDRPEMGELRDGLRHPATPTTAPHRAVTDTTL